MATSPSRHARRRIRTAATTLCALTLGAATVGAGVAYAHQPAPLPHTPKSLTNRILSTVDTGNVAGASKTTELEYVNPSSHVTYQLLDQYAGAKPNYIEWAKETPKGSKRSVDQIDVNPQQKQWSEQTGIVAVPAVPLGIQSTGSQVKQAIAQGKAHKQGMTKIARQTTLALSLKPSSAHIKSDTLYVDPSTDQPVVETQTITSGGHTFTITSNWLKATPHAVSHLEAKPNIPSGYTKSNS